MRERHDSAKRSNGHVIIDIENYIPFFFSVINNAISRSASKLYREQFNIGIVDWRVLSMLAIEPSIPATRICEVISLDKGAASRSLKVLDEKGFLIHRPIADDLRKKAWQLSDRGYNLHDQIMQIALERETELIEGIALEDVATFIKVARAMLANTIRMDAQE